MILSGEFLGVLIMVFLGLGSLAAVFWGAWLGWACALYVFLCSGRDAGTATPAVSGLEEFRSESREIARDLGEFNERTG